MMQTSIRGLTLYKVQESERKQTILVTECFYMLASEFPTVEFVLIDLISGNTSALPATGHFAAFD